MHYFIESLEQVQKWVLSSTFVRTCGHNNNYCPFSLLFFFQLIFLYTSHGIDGNQKRKYYLRMYKKFVRKRVFVLPTGDKWQSKTLFLAIFYPLSSIVKSNFDCRLSGVNMII